MIWAVLLSGIMGLGAGCSSSKPSLPEPISPPAFARKWSTNLDLRDDKITQLYIREDLLLAYTRKGLSYIVKRDTGETVRADAVPGGEYRFRPPVVLKDVIVYPTTTMLEIFNRRSGDHTRSLDLKAAIAGNAVGERNDVYAPLALPQHAALRKVDLTRTTSTVPTWELEPYDGAILSAPVIHTDTVYLATDTGKVYAVSTDQRLAIWPLESGIFDAAAPIVADLQADDFGLYVPTLGAGRLYCLNRVSGQVKWQYFASGGLTASPVVTPDTVYQMDPFRGMVAIQKQEDPDLKTQYNRQPGKGVRWSSTDITQILSQDEDHTYALRKDGVIVALNKRTGETMFTSRHKDLTVYAVNTKDGMIYGTTNDGRLVAIRAVYQAGQVGEVVRNDSPNDLAETVAMGR